MCGFVALFSPKGFSESPSIITKTMCDLMTHRGPNHYGYYEDSHCALGHRRLSIIDLSNMANQPFEKDNLVIAFNGEIYNYLEIRKELEDSHQVHFKTNSDTEVLLEGFRIWREAALEKLNGMFAFVILDKLEKIIFVARDRLGVKPLFFTKVNDVHYFASDIKSLWEVVPLSQKINSQAISGFLAYSFISGNDTSTIGIKKFPPAHYAYIHTDTVTSTPYWDLNHVDTLSKQNFGDAVEETHQVLKQAIKIRLRSDVPLGCFLSGGVDSSLVTAMSATELNRSFHTYSIGFDQSEFNEEHYARRVSRRYQTQHHGFQLSVQSLEQLPEIVWKFSEPFGDSSALPSYFVAQEASQNLKVVLTGDGADEAFGGYVDPFAMYLTQKLKFIPRGLLSFFTRNRFFSRHRLLKRFSKFASISGLDPWQFYLSLKSGGWSQYPEAFSQSMSNLEFTKMIFEECQRSSPVDKMIYTDIFDRLIADFLVKVDMATMAHSLEARSPFLDYRMIELGYSQPHSLIFHHLHRKAILKKIAERYIDKDILYRKKMGFSIPKSKWLKTAPFDKIIQTLVKKPNETLDHILNPSIRNQVVHEFYIANNLAHNNRIWLILWFQIWHGLFVTKEYKPNQKLSELE